MTATQQVVTEQAVKNIYQSKAEHLFKVLGPTAAKDFACDIAPVSDAETMMKIVKFLDSKGCNDEAISVLKETCRTHGDDLKAHETLGRRTRSILPIHSPVTTDTRCKTPIKDCEYVTVLGNSFVRSFANGTAFLPIMVSNGAKLGFLTPDTADVTRRLIWNSISRVDPKSLILMVFGNSDAVLHARNMLGTWQAVCDKELPSHDIVIRTAAQRYLELVEEIRTKTKLNLVLFTATPMLLPEKSWMIAAYNDELHKYSRSSGVPILDLTDKVSDPSTGLLKKELCSIEGNSHMSHDCIPLVKNGLKELSVLPGEGHPFEWDYMFRLPFDPEIEARIWCEPQAGHGARMMASPKIKLTQILERAAHILIGHLAAYPGSEVLIVNGREGYIALETPIICAAQITSIDERFSKILMAQRIAKLFGRDNICFETTSNYNELKPDSYDYVMLVMHEDDNVDSCLEMIEQTTHYTNKKILVVTPLDIASNLSELPKIRAVSEINLSNRFVTGYWSGARVISLTMSGHA